MDLWSVILEHFGENDERGVVVSLIHVRYIMAVAEPRLARENQQKSRLYN